MEAHSHGFVEVAVVVGGTAVHRSLAGYRHLAVGDAVLVRPGVWHGYEDCRGLEVFNCCFGVELLQRELAWMRDDPLLGHLLWTGPRSRERRGQLGLTLDDASLAECRRHLYALEGLGSASGRYRGDVVGRLSLLLSVLARAAERTRPTDADDAAPHPAAVAAMRLLETRLARPWTVADLAGELHVSAGHLSRVFKAATGMSPMAYLAQHRAETAAALLLRTDRLVGRVGGDVGWPDPNLFARRFRAHMGMSPTAYRRRFTGQDSADSMR
jgi:AraC family L-rhamnose operon transcriptional activator RhaR